MTDVNLETVKTRDNSEYTRDEFTQLFIDLVKVCKPEHPYTDVSGVDTPSDTVTAFEYADLTHEHIKTGWKRKDSNSWASCGPRHFPPYIAYYGIDLGYFQSVSMERVLAVTTHELTHIPIGRHNGLQAASHPPEFWDEMAYHAQCVLDALPEIEARWGPIDEVAFREEIVSDPNEYMVDCRSDSLDNVVERMSGWVKEYTPDHQN